MNYAVVIPWESQGQPLATQWESIGHHHEQELGHIGNGNGDQVEVPWGSTCACNWNPMGIPRKGNTLDTKLKSNGEQIAWACTTPAPIES